MRWRFGRIVCIVLVTVDVSQLGSVAEAEDVHSAEFLVQQAQEAEARGDLAGRAAKLEAALDKDPQLPAANWLAGRVRTNESWVSAADARVASDDAREQEFRTKRLAVHGNVKNLLELARCCDKQHWADRARLYYSHVLGQAGATAEMKREAVKHLNLVSYQGQWLPKEMAQAREAEFTKEQKGVENWVPKLADLQKPLESEQAARAKFGRQKLEEIQDEGAIAATEVFVLTESPKFAEALVSLLARLNTPRSTTALTRFAVLSPLGEIRDQATKALEKRPLAEYVPVMIGALEGEVYTQFGIFLSPNGQIRMRHVMEYDAKTGKVTYINDRTESRVTMTFMDFFTEGNRNEIGRNRNEAQDLADARVQQQQRAGELVQQAAVIDATAKMRNEWAKLYNGRFVAVLQRTTGQNLPAKAVDWWTWWEDYNDSQYRSQQSQYNYNQSQAVYSVKFIVIRHSCFTAETRVWTEEGLKAISTIQAGDRVLSQNPDTGELAYRLVLHTTQRPDAELSKVQIANEHLTASTGHPFWVNKRGWQLTKELKAGDLLHTVDGCVDLQAVEKRPDKATVYNLVVADWNTYFVGVSGVLVHDVTFRQATRGIVPGLVAK